VLSSNQQLAQEQRHAPVEVAIINLIKGQIGAGAFVPALTVEQIDSAA
jgi:hypothetical protein